MNKVVDIGEMIPLICEKLNSGGEVKFSPKGNSMLPLFRSDLDMVTLASPDYPLKKYQITLYCRDNGQYVLHRVVKVKKDSYVMRGDNQLVNEEGIRDDQIIGIVTNFTRKGKEYSVGQMVYRMYSFWWVNSLFLKKTYKRTRRFAGRIKRKLLRK